jgi:hypothetical protein
MCIGRCQRQANHQTIRTQFCTVAIRDTLGNAYGQMQKSTAGSFTDASQGNEPSAFMMIFPIFPSVV